MQAFILTWDTPAGCFGDRPRELANACQEYDVDESGVTKRFNSQSWEQGRADNGTRIDVLDTNHMIYETT